MKVYPEVITKTNLRPDAVLISEASRTVVLVELTVPYETNMNESHEYKAAKYEGLVQEIRQAGYRPHLFPVEIGARGMAGGRCISVQSAEETWTSQPGAFQIPEAISGRC